MNKDARNKKLPQNTVLSSSVIVQGDDRGHHGEIMSHIGNIDEQGIVNLPEWPSIQMLFQPDANPTVSLYVFQVDNFLLDSLLGEGFVVMARLFIFELEELFCTNPVRIFLLNLSMIIIATFPVESISRCQVGCSQYGSDGQSIKFTNHGAHFIWKIVVLVFMT